jgi:hypothetical protein
MSHSRVKLPPGVRPPFDIYLNGVLQRLGDDYEVREGALVFDQPLAKEGRLGFWRWFFGAFGIGTYRQNDAVDVHYEVDGRPVVAHALEIEPLDG